MTGRILIVDDVATNRIVMKVKLTAACYSVLQADCGAAALDLARAELPDLILLDVMMPDMTGVEVCRRLKADPATADIPIILITALSDRANKMAGLQGGADDFLTKPVDEVTLLARVRSLLRASDIQQELHLREESCAGLGFSEAGTGYAAPGRVALVAPDAATGLAWKRALSGRLKDRLEVVPREQALQGQDPDQVPDVHVIAADLAARNEGLRLLSDLRSRPASRHAAALMILPPGDDERGAVALDLGAGDILYDPFDAEELALRIQTQLRRKRQSDRLRDAVAAGLELAVTDSLTGLHNRRYALRRLARMLATPGRGVAVMMLDLDHFKSVNDTHGHAAGDAVLAEVARRLRDALRPADLLARLGGEEFLVALRDIDCDSALDRAESLRAAVGGQPVTIAGAAGPVPVTMSVGLAMCHGGGESGAEVIARADRALYGSKSDGRNLVTVSTSASAA